MFGIACILLATPIIGALVPLLFNNFAFMYLTVTGIAAQLPEPNPYLWMAITGIGGALLIAGVVGLGKLRSRPAIGK